MDASTTSTVKQEATALQEEGLAAEREKKWSAAAEKYVAAGSKLQPVHPEESAKHFVRAASVYKMDKSYAKAVEWYKHSVKLLLSAFSQNSVAELWVNVAQCETLRGDLDRAIGAWKMAIQIHTENKLDTEANQAVLEVAHLLVRKREFKEAIKLYEQVATEWAHNRLLAFSLPEITLKILLCAMIVDKSNVQIRLKQCSDEFLASRQGRLIQALAGNDETTKLNDHIYNYTRLFAPDPATQTIFQILIRRK